MDFLLSWQSYYETIQLKGNVVVKKIVIYKEFELITETKSYVQTEEEIIKMIRYMNKNKKYFIFYDYEVKVGVKIDEIIIKHRFVPTLEMYCKRHGFTKKNMDKMVEDMCNILDIISWHGSISRQTIYVKNDHYYLSDMHFKEILSNNKKPRSIQDDIYSFVLVLYNIIKSQSDLRELMFFKKGLSSENALRFQTLEEMKKSYFLEMEDFVIDKQSKIFINRETMVFTENHGENKNHFQK